MLRSHKQAVPAPATMEALGANGWQDRTDDVRSRGDQLLPGPVVDHLQLGRDRNATVAELAGIDPVQPQVVALHPDLWHDDPVMVAESWLVTSTERTNDHQVDWDAVDTTWHLHGDDEALLRAVIDIGLMGRLSELDGRWIVRFVGQTLMVIPTAPKNRLVAKPPTLIDVAAEIGDVVVEVRGILPQILFDDLDELLAAYRL
jgi:hypothetical protein